MSDSILTTRLPRELINNIVEGLDTRTIASLSCTSSGVREVVKPLLFRQLTIHTDHATHHLNHFIAFLKANPISTSDMALHVKTLTLLCNSPMPRSDVMRESITALDLDFVLSRLPSVQTLHLRLIPLRCCTSTPPSGWSNPRSLNELSITYVEFQPSRLRSPQDTFLELLGLFGSVKIMKLNAARIWDYDPGVTDSHPEPSTQVLRRRTSLNVERLFHVGEIRYSYLPTSTTTAPPPIVTSLMESPHCLSRMRTLDIDEDIAITNTLLRAIGHQLSHLHLRINSERAPFSEDTSPFDLDNCKNISSLNISVRLLSGDEPDVKANITRVIKTLEQSPESVTKIVVKCVFNHYRPSDAISPQEMGWKDVDEILGRHAQFESFVLIIRDTFRMNDGLVESIRERVLSRLAKRGILKVVRSYPTEQDDEEEWDYYDDHADMDL
ncbi:hypothetical protein BXZ70DRAFT_1062498 [Cristinia sonorae]|uniref:F-box domain-containing protein n=1 Tax=Cristinia sonorae TaxID=1940300 RepID=A0A8K0XSI8_9AGAR|nr:hypothetical protein BXZ70DRAFT_1062498 [Cristinia sonorae]